MKVKTDFEGCRWLTAGKVYEAEQDEDDPDLVHLTDDTGFKIGCRISGCAHLDHNKWQVVEGVNKMTEIVKHEGKEYEIGKVYEFSNNGIDWAVGVLSGIDLSSFPFDSDRGRKSSSHCREVKPESLGKITKAKINPEVGKVYKFHGEGETIYVKWKKESSLHDGWEIICEMVEKND